MPFPRYLVADRRYLGEGGPSNANEDYYMWYDCGIKKEFQSRRLDQEPRNNYEPPDEEWVQLSSKNLRAAH